MKYTAALIGTGRIGFTLGFDKKREQPASHTMALKGNKSIDLVAAADTSEKNLQKWQKYVSQHRLGQSKPAQIFNSSDELYKTVKNLDIITVAVNEDNHMAECIKAIEYKPRLVILEKPVALNSEEAKKIADCAAKNGVPVMVNHERRFAKDYLAAKELMNQIGDIQSIHAELDSGLRIYGEEFEKDGTYSLLHDGTHLVDIVQFLLEENTVVEPENTVVENGSTLIEKDNAVVEQESTVVEPSRNHQIKTISADSSVISSAVEKSPLLQNPTVTGIHKDEKNIVRNFTAHYTTEKIPEITIKMSGRSKFFEFRIEILGTLGKIVVGNGIHEFYLRKESKLYTGFYSLTPQKLKLPKKTGYFSGMVQNAVDFLEGKSELVSPLEDAIKDLQVLEEIKAKF